MTRPAAPLDELDAMSMPSKSFVAFSIVITLVLIGAVGALLMHGSLTQHVPPFVVVVHANAKWRGTRLTLTGGPLREPMQASLERHNKFHVPFFVPEGDYTLKIEPPANAPHVESLNRHFSLHGDAENPWVDLPQESGEDEDATTQES